MTDTTNADMKDYWNGEAGQKWVRFQQRMDINLLPFARVTMDKAAVSAGEAVLDIGCGCGDTAIRLARAAGARGRVLGADISETVLARARKRAEDESLETLSFENADAQTHDFEAAAFDLVFSRFGVMFFDDPTAAFGNIRRALKPGGRLAFICWQAAPDNLWMREPLEIIGRHIPLPEPPDPEAPGPTAFRDRARVERILSAAGYAEISIEACDTAMTLGRNLDEAVDLVMQMGPGGAAVIQSEADEATKARIAAELRTMLADRETPDGVTLGAATWLVTARNG